jgi:protein-tyrosine phosphatase
MSVVSCIKKGSYEVCYFDIHSHILPGVDDGARDMEETMRMLTMAYEEGIRVMVATPHYEVGRNNAAADKLRQLHAMVKQEINKAGIDLVVLLGNEIRYSISVIEALNRGEALTMDGTRYILVEFHPSTPYKQIWQGLNDCIFAGYFPILAHAERYQCLVKNPKLVGELNQLGTYIQINLSSITGGITNPKTHFCRKIIKKGWVHFLGTDSHNAKERIPRAKEAVAFLTKKYGEPTVKQLFWENPLSMIANKHNNELNHVRGRENGSKE